MHVLQISAPKSGSMWLHRTLQSMFRKAGLPQRSVIRSHPIHPIAKTWDLSYPEQADIDMLDIEPLACYYRISSIFRMPIVNFADYVHGCTHVWTHSPLCPQSFALFSHFDKIIYIARDPRDRALSDAKFAFTPYMQKYYPHHEENTASYLQSQLPRLTREWRWHVGDHLRYAEPLDIHFLFYERLLDQFESELAALLNYLEIDLPAAQRREVRDEVSFSTMRAQSPQHVRRGTWGHWQERLSDAQAAAVAEEVGPLLDALGYATRKSDKLTLPARSHLSQQQVETVLGL